jgi:hypothetical protein
VRCPSLRSKSLCRFIQPAGGGCGPTVRKGKRGRA